MAANIPQPPVAAPPPLAARPEDFDQLTGRIKVNSSDQAVRAQPTLSEQILSQFNALERIRLSEMIGMMRRGVSAEALAMPEFPARGRVAFVDSRAWFDFADGADDDREPEVALIFLARDELGELLDLIAWSPKSGRVGAWLGRAPALGLETLWAARLDHDGALPVFETPLRWLAAGREGLLLIDPPHAAPTLREATAIIAESVDVGERLLDLLTVKPPRVLAFTNPAEIADG